MLIEITRPNEVTLGRRAPPFYVAVLKRRLDIYPDTDFQVRGIGENTKNAIEVVGTVSREFNDGSMVVYDGNVSISKKIYPDENEHASIEILCKRVTNNADGYRTFRNLNDNPWPGNVFSIRDNSSTVAIQDILDALKEEGEISLVGYESGIRGVFNLCNKLREEMVDFTLGYDMELGSMRERKKGLYGYSVKIKVKANENN